MVKAVSVVESEKGKDFDVDDDGAGSISSAAGNAYSPAEADAEPFPPTIPEHEEHWPI